MPSPDRAPLRCLISELKRKADRPVLVTCDGVVRAGELAARAQARAGDLTWVGASAGTAAALVIADRIDLVAAMLACLEAGVVFVPISPGEPSARLEHLLRASGARVALCDDLGAESLAALDGGRQVSGSRGRLLGPAAEPMTFTDDACYVYFTSGTTGQPRPLLGRADSLRDFVDWELGEFGIGTGDRCSQFIRPTFDAFLRDTLVPLSGGATLHLPPADPFSLEPREIWSWLRSQRVTVVHTVPTLLRRITDGANGPLADLRCLLVSGEPLLGSDIERWQAAGNDPAVMVNLYGPTETTMIKLFHRVGPADTERQRIPVGKPIRGSQAYIADTGLRPVPPGTAGEVIIRTPFATAGYLDSERHGPGGFASNPFTKDETDLLYRTGDVGRQLADGDIELLGRMDDQMKVAGARIEPAEVEHALLRHEGVREAAVDVVGGPDASRLIAWVVASDGTPPADADVRLCAARHLPAELIPGQLVWLAALPVTSSGKVDRASLRTSYEQLATSRDDTAPVTATEKAVHDIVTSVIGTEAGTHADFFAVGGTSLAATQVIARLRRKFGCDLGVRELFENPTIAALARRVDQASAILARPEPVTVPPPSAAQRRIWFVHQLQPDDPAYTITAAAQVPGPLDISALGRAASAVLRHREALRCAFTATEGELALSVTDPGPVPISRFDVDVADGGLAELINAQARTVFPLHSGNLLRIGVAHSDTVAPVVILSTHHIVADEMSIWLLAADLRDAYNCELADVAWQPERPADRGYARFALAQQDWAKSPAWQRALSHWTELAAGIPALGIASGTGASGPGGTVRFDFGAEAAAMLSSCAREMRVTLYNALTAVLHITLSAMTGVTDVATTTSVDLRDSVELERSVGLFVNSVVMRSALVPGATFRDVACALRDQWAQAQPHLRCPYDDVVAAIRPDHAPGRRILSEVNFDFHDRRHGDGPLGEAGAHALEVDHASAKFPVDISVVRSGERLEGQLRFQRGRVAGGTAGELVRVLVETARAASADHELTVRALARGDDSLSSHLVNEFASGA